MGAVEGASVVVTNLRDVRTEVGYRLWERDGNGLGMAILAELSLPTGSEGVFGGTGAWGAGLGVSVDHMSDDWVLGGHVAGRYARVAEIGVSRVGSEVRVAGGVARYFWREALRLSFEVDSRFRISSQGAQAEDTQHLVEYGFGVRYRPPVPGDYAIVGHLSTGVGGLGAPDLRALVGIRFGSSGPP